MCGSEQSRKQIKKKFFVDNQLVRIHFIIEMTCWTGVAPWDFEFPFSGSPISTFLVYKSKHDKCGGVQSRHCPRPPNPPSLKCHTSAGERFGVFRFCLTQCIIQMVLESQIPHKIVNLLFYYSDMTSVGAYSVALPLALQILRV